MCILLHIIPGGVNAIYRPREKMHGEEDGEVHNLELLVVLAHASFPLADFTMFPFAVINGNREYDSFQ